MVQSLHKACRAVGRSRRISSELSQSGGSGGVAVGAGPRNVSMSFLEDEEEVVEVKPITRFSSRESKRAINRINRSSGETTPLASHSPRPQR